MTTTTFVYPIEVPEKIEKIDKNKTLDVYLTEILNKEIISEPDVEDCKSSNQSNPSSNTSGGQKTKGPVKLTISIKTNKYFIITLKLFKKNDKKQNIKINPNLIISKQITVDNKKYNLSGFIMHIGSSNKGHYTFYKVLADGSGILYDDDAVSDKTHDEINQILNDNNVEFTPYVLLYEQAIDENINPLPPPPPPPPPRSVVFTTS
jgi:ubiquitin C-terminal hydrolase